MRKMKLVLLFVLMVFLLAACDSSKPDDRETKSETTPTEKPADALTPTELPATPTDEVTPEATPTETTAPTPEATPTETPTPEATPTETPTPTPEATPTETPTPTPEATSTPTPTEAPQLPAVAATAGPAYVIGEADWYYYLMDDNDPDQGLHLGLVYIVDPGYEDLARHVQGMTSYATMDVFLSYIASASGTSGKTDDEILKHHLKAVTEVGRADSLVFSIVTRFSGYKTDMGYREYFYTDNYDTKTGKILSLDQMVTDLEALYNAITEVVDKEFGNQGVFRDDSWKEKFHKRLFAGTINWLAVDEGLEFMFDSFDYSMLTVDSLTLRVNIVDYPGLFVPERVGGYDGSLKRTFDFSSFGTDTYKAVIPELVKGLRKLTWKDTANLLTKAGIAYEGMDDEEAANYESDAEISFSDTVSGKSYRLDFWPFDNETVQRLEGIFFRFGSNIYIDNAYGTLAEPRYVMVDPWIYDDYEKTIAVHFSCEEDLRAVIFGALDNYR